MEKGASRERQSRKRRREGGVRKTKEIENQIKWEYACKYISHHYKCKWFEFNYYKEQTHILDFKE